MTAPHSAQELDDFFLSFHISATDTPTQPAQFLLDSASPYHIVNNRSLFTGNLKPTSRHISGIGGQTAVTGIGSIELRTNLGASVKLTNVHFAPDVPANIVSVFQMAAKGVHTSFRGHHARLTFKSIVFATATVTSSDHYSLDIQQPFSNLLLTGVQPPKVKHLPHRPVWPTVNRFQSLPTDVAA